MAPESISIRPVKLKNSSKKPVPVKWFFKGFTLHGFSTLFQCSSKFRCSIDSKLIRGKNFSANALSHSGAPFWRTSRGRLIIITLKIHTNCPPTLSPIWHLFLVRGKLLSKPPNRTVLCKVNLETIGCSHTPSSSLLRAASNNLRADLRILNLNHRPVTLQPCTRWLPNRATWASRDSPKTTIERKPS